MYHIATCLVDKSLPSDSGLISTKLPLTSDLDYTYICQVQVYVLHVHVGTYNTIIVNSISHVFYLIVPSTNIMSTIADATKRLQQRYINNRFSSSVDEWPPYQPKHYTTLAFIHNKDRSRHTDAARFSFTQKLAFSGDVNTSQPYSNLTANMTRNISDIFLPVMASDESPLDLHILIEGAPGIGKTVLTKEIAYQWAKTELLKSKKLVLLIFLRECHQTQLRSIESLVQHVFESKILTTCLSEYLLQTDGEDTVIMFDGYDELSEESRNESVIDDIICRKKLTKSCLVITSRPTVSSCLHRLVDRRVEIVGFTEEDRLDYIQSALENLDERIKALQCYLRSNPTINALCYIPLNMTILLCLVEDGIDRLPKTQTEMYKNFIQMTIVRFIKKYGNCKAVIDIAELPDPYDKLFVELTRLAYKALKTDKIVFTLPEIKEGCPNLVMTSSNWNGLGLLKAIKYFSAQMGNDQVTFHFLHFSIQEYMAAWYITTLSDSKQIKLLQKKFWEHRYYNTWIMYVGITGGSSFALKHFLSGNRFQFYSKLFKTSKIANKYLKNKMKCLHLFQCLVEAKTQDFMEPVKQLFQNRQIDLSNQTLLPSDLNTLGFFLIRSINKEWDELNLSNCNIGSNGSNILCDTFMDKDIRCIVTIKMVNFSYNQLDFPSLIRLFDLLNSWHTSEIIITDDALLDNETDIKTIEDIVLQSNTLTLVLIGSYFFSKSLLVSKVFHILSTTTNIKRMYLLNCSWNSNNYETLEMLDLLKKQELQRVRIIGSFSNKLFIMTLASILLKNNDSVNMFVYDPTMSDQTADGISSSIFRSYKDISGVMLIVSSSKVQGVVNTCLLSNELSALEIINLSIYERYLNTKICPWREHLEEKSHDTEYIVTFIKLIHKADNWTLKITLLENNTLIVHNTKLGSFNKLDHFTNNKTVIYLSSCDVSKVEYDYINKKCSHLYILNSPECVELLHNELLHKQFAPNKLFVYGNIKCNLMNSLIELLSHDHLIITAVLAVNGVIVGIHPSSELIALAFQLQPLPTTWILSTTTGNSSVFYQVIDAITIIPEWIELDFTGYDISDVDCEVVQKTFRHNNCSTIRKLNISFNKLSVSGVLDLARIVLIWRVEILNINGTNDALLNYFIKTLTHIYQFSFFLSITYNHQILLIICNTRWNDVITKINTQATELYITNCDLLLDATEIIDYLDAVPLLRLCIINGSVSAIVINKIFEFIFKHFDTTEISISNIKIIDDEGMIRNFLSSNYFYISRNLNLVVSIESHWICVYNATKNQSRFIHQYFMSQTPQNHYGMTLIRKLEQLSGDKMYIFHNNLVNLLFIDGNIKDSFTSTMVNFTLDDGHKLSAVLFANNIMVGIYPSSQQIAAALHLQPSPTTWVQYTTVNVSVFYQILDTLATVHTEWIELDFAHCNITDIDCNIMRRNLGLKDCFSTVKRLDISFNRLSISGIFDLVRIVLTWRVLELNINGNNDIFYDCLMKEFLSKHQKYLLTISYNQKTNIICNSGWNTTITMLNVLISELYIINCDLNSKEIISYLNSTDILLRLCVINGSASAIFVIEIVKSVVHKPVEVSISNVKIVDDDRMIRNLIISKEFYCDAKLSLMLSTNSWICVYNAAKYQLPLIHQYFMNHAQPDYCGITLIKKFEQLNGDKLFIFEDNPINLPFICGNLKDSLMNSSVEFTSYNDHEILTAANDAVRIYPSSKQMTLVLHLETSQITWTQFTAVSVSVFYQIIDALSILRTKWAELDFTHCNIGDMECEIMQKSLECNNLSSTVTKLNISLNTLSISGISDLVRIMLMWKVQELNISGTNDVLYDCLIRNLKNLSTHQSDVVLFVTYNHKILNKITATMNTEASELYIINCELQSKEIASYLNVAQNLLKVVINGTISETVLLKIVKYFLDKTIEVSISNVKIVDDDRMIRNLIISREFYHDAKLSLILSTNSWLCVYNATKHQLPLIHQYFMDQVQPDYCGITLIKKLEQLNGDKLFIFENNPINLPFICGNLKDSLMNSSVEFTSYNDHKILAATNDAVGIYPSSEQMTLVLHLETSLTTWIQYTAVSVSVFYQIIDALSILHIKWAELDFTHCNIGDMECEIMQKSLKYNITFSTVKTLNISLNKLSISGISDFVRIVLIWKVQELNISGSNDVLYDCLIKNLTNGSKYQSGVVICVTYDHIVSQIICNKGWSKITTIMNTQASELYIIYCKLQQKEVFSYLKEAYSLLKVYVINGIVSETVLIKVVKFFLDKPVEVSISNVKIVDDERMIRNLIISREFYHDAKLSLILSTNSWLCVYNATKHQLPLIHQYFMDQIQPDYCGITLIKKFEQLNGDKLFIFENNPINLPFICGNLKDSLMNSSVEFTSYNDHKILAATNDAVGIYPSSEQMTLVLHLETSLTTWIQYTAVSVSVFYQIIDALSILHIKWAELDFTHCNIGDMECEIMQKSLKYNIPSSTVKTLNISLNKLSISGISDFVRIVLIWKVQELNISESNDVLYDCLIKNLTNGSKYQSGVVICVTYDHIISQIICNKSWSKITTIMNTQASELYIIYCKLQQKEFFSYLKEAHSLLKVYVINGIVSETVLIKVVKFFLDKPVEVSISNVKIVDDERMIRNLIISREFYHDAKLSLILSTNSWLCVYNATKHQLPLIHQYFMDQIQPDYCGITLIKKLEQLNGDKLFIFENNPINLPFICGNLKDSLMNSSVEFTSYNDHKILAATNDAVGIYHSSEQMTLVLHLETSLTTWIQYTAVSVSVFYQIIDALSILHIKWAELDFTHCNIGDMECEIMQKSLKYNIPSSTVKTLNISLNKLSISGISDFVRIVLIWKVQELNISESNDVLYDCLIKNLTNGSKYQSGVVICVTYDHIISQIICNKSWSKITTIMNTQASELYIIYCKLQQKEVFSYLKEAHSLLKVYVINGIVSKTVLIKVVKFFLDKPVEVSISNVKIVDDERMIRNLIISREFYHDAKLSLILSTNSWLCVYNAAKHQLPLIHQYFMDQVQPDYCGITLIQKFEQLNGDKLFIFENNPINLPFICGNLKDSLMNSSVEFTSYNDHNILAATNDAVGIYPSSEQMTLVLHLETSLTTWIQYTAVSVSVFYQIVDALSILHIKWAELDFTNCNIGDMECEIMQKSLKYNIPSSTVKTLSISLNTLSISGISDFVKIVLIWKVQELNISESNDVLYDCLIKNLTNGSKYQSGVVICVTYDHIISQIICNKSWSKITTIMNTQASELYIIYCKLQQKEVFSYLKEAHSLLKVYVINGIVSKTVLIKVVKFFLDKPVEVSISNVKIVDDERMIRNLIISREFYHDAKLSLILSTNSWLCVYNATKHQLPLIHQYFMDQVQPDYCGITLIKKFEQLNGDKLFIFENNPINLPFICGNLKDSLMNSSVEFTSYNDHKILAATNDAVGIYPSSEQMTLVLHLETSLTTWIQYTAVSVSVFYQIIDALSILHIKWAELDFTHCNIGDMECEIMQKSLKCNNPSSTVTKLNISLNKLSISGISDFVRIVLMWKVQELNISGTIDVLYDCLIKNLTNGSEYQSDVVLFVTCNQKILQFVCNRSWNTITATINIQASELYIINCISNNINLQEFNIVGNTVKAVGAMKISRGLQKISNLTKFCINNNKITDEAADDIATVILNNTNLQEFDIGRNNLKAVGAMKIAKSLQKISMLTKLCLNNNNITEEAADDIATALSSNSSLQEFDIGRNALETVGIIKIARSLQKISSLTKLYIDNNNISDGAANEIAIAIGRNIHLQHFNIGKNNIQSFGAIKIAKSLQKVSTITKLCLHGNCITDKAAEDIAIAITCNVNIRVLDIGKNKFCAPGAVTIARALRKLLTLRKLCFDYEDTFKEAAADVAFAICCNTNLKEVSVNGKECPEIGHRDMFRKINYYQGRDTEEI